MLIFQTYFRKFFNYIIENIYNMPMVKRTNTLMELYRDNNGGLVATPLTS